MKRLYLLTIACTLASLAFAQQKTTTDTVLMKTSNDTIRIGSILIIKSAKKGNHKSAELSAGDNHTRFGRVSTNYGILDLGFANWTDQTNYSNAGSYLANRPGYPALSAPDFKLRTGKSINVNFWFFMQKLALVKRNINLKYGLGLELNNYRFRSPLSFKENGVIPYSGGMQTNSPYVFRDSISFSKDKLAADYLTIPLMINFASNYRHGKPGFGASFGVSGGYLYSQRNKEISNERGKQKNKGDYDLERFKFSYIGELSAGPVRFYGSYTPRSIFEHSLDLRPFTVGIRFSNW